MGKVRKTLIMLALLVFAFMLIGMVGSKMSGDNSELPKAVQTIKYTIEDGKIKTETIELKDIKAQKILSASNITYYKIYPEYRSYVNLRSYSFSLDVILDIYNWVKKSYYSTYDYCTPLRYYPTCGSFEKIEEFEFNAPSNISIFAVTPSYYLTNLGGGENSNDFLVNISIFDFKNNFWQAFYTDNSTANGWKGYRVSVNITPNFLNNSRMRIKARIKSTDTDIKRMSFTVFQYPNGSTFEASFLFNNLVYEYAKGRVTEPITLNIPDRKIPQDTQLDKNFIDLWQYVNYSQKEKLKFSITSQSNKGLIDCSIYNNRYVTCKMPTKDKEGYSDIVIEVKDRDGNSGSDIFRIKVISPTLKILIIPFDWSGTYEDYYSQTLDIESYFLQRIPLSDCPEQFKFMEARENESYGNNWDKWQCKVSESFFGGSHCFPGNRSLKEINKCGNEYAKMKNEKYDFVVGISDADIGLSKGVFGCNYNVDGWSDGEGGMPSVIAESYSEGITLHELGHEFGLSDQYCNCDGTKSEKFCGTKVKYSKLKTELGCNPDISMGSCCGDEGITIYPGCKISCYGNFDRFGKDTDQNGILDDGYRTSMSSKLKYPYYNSNHFDINEYNHLQDIDKLKCQSGISGMRISSIEQENKTPNLQIILDIDINNNVTLDSMNLTEQEQFSEESSGDYSLRILDSNNNIVHKKNFSIDFIIFSDPPIITNESIIFEIVKYNESMKKLEIYYNNSKIFSQSIQSFCNRNSVCETGEDYLSCSDCKSNARDGRCNRQEGDGCDFDCVEGLDADCVELVINNVTISNITKGKKATAKINLSNLGERNVFFGIGLSSSGIRESNFSLSIPGNFSGLITFNFTPQYECSRDISFVLDSLNNINEINKTNNEIIIENVKINIQGDTNFDKKVDIFDLASVGICYGKQVSGSCVNADVREDNKIDIFDLATVGRDYGKVCEK